MLVIALAGSALAACQPRAVPLPPDEAAAFAAEVEPVVENMLEGLSAGDYAQHARDFDEELREQVDEIVVFPQVYAEVIGVAGEYRSHTFVSAADQGALRIATYNVAFADEPHVIMRVFFRRDDPAYLISGLLFDSPKLRGGQ